MQLLRPGQVLVFWCAHRVSIGVSSGSHRPTEPRRNPDGVPMGAIGARDSWICRCTRQANNTKMLPALSALTLSDKLNIANKHKLHALREVPSTSMKREAEEADKLYVAELEVYPIMVWRGLSGAIRMTTERQCVLRYAPFMGSSPGGARVVSIRPFLKDMLQEAANRHDSAGFIVHSPHFASTKDLTSCFPLDFGVSYPKPFTPESFQNAIVDALTDHPNYIAFRDLCGTDNLLQSEPKRVRYGAL